MATMNLMLDTNPLPLDSLADELVNSLGINLFDEEIDNVIIQTNEFLTDPTFIGQSGPFWWLSEIPDLRGSNHPENQSLGDLSRETNVLGGTKTGQN